MKKIEIYGLRLLNDEDNNNNVQLELNKVTKKIIVEFLKTQGYFVYNGCDCRKIFFLEGILKEVSTADSDTDTIIVSKDNLLPQIKELTTQKIPKFYIEILEKFKSTELFESIERAIYHIEKNYSVTELSAISYMTCRNFTRRFKTISGMSFLEFYRPLKIELAKEMMAQGTKVKEVAENLGFSEVNYFNRVFKKMVGMTPTQYKKNCKK